ncbi:MAG TPA: hypothetical protein VK499_13375, partial [Propionibacteriaceae bacterium]|nr:hypothetical protein [Propionibacteriaceae bacterium]
IRPRRCGRVRRHDRAGAGQDLARGVRFEVGRAERIASLRPSLGLDDHIDGVLAAYLFRALLRGSRS